MGNGAVAVRLPLYRRAIMKLFIALICFTLVQSMPADELETEGADRLLNNCPLNGNVNVNKRVCKEIMHKWVKTIGDCGEKCKMWRTCTMWTYEKNPGQMLNDCYLWKDGGGRCKTYPTREKIWGGPKNCMPNREPR